MNLTVRHAELMDIDHIVRLVAELAASTGESSLVTPTYVANYLAYPTSRVLLAELQGEIIGLLSYSIRPNLYHVGDCCTIEEFIVQTSVCGQGIGSTLLKYLFSQPEVIRCAEVSVSTLLNNEQAIEFYRTHGFTDEALLLEKHL
jgi:ribosomal protein S18 acetylase RimI-like enzyme